MFPAPAGMSPMCPRPCSIRLDVPRARGDEPLVIDTVEVDAEMFPAPAGMSLFATCPTCGRYYVPRARGDEPLFRW